MDEKGDLLEKQSSLLQRLSDAQDRNDNIRNELESAKSRSSTLVSKLQQVLSSDGGGDDTYDSLKIKLEEIIKNI